MMKNLIFMLLLCLSTLSYSEVRISLITTSPGNETHTLFGHSCLRVINSDANYDRLYNYGLFDFKTPLFPIRFLKGDLEYWLGRKTLERFIEVNNKEKRTITEQQLNLNQNQALRIFSFLEKNAKSENKFYRYSFTQRNCATEIRDIFLAQGLIGSKDKLTKTYRQLLNEYMQHHYWFRFGINMLLGTKVEEVMTFEEQLFMPAKLSDAVAAAPGLVSETQQLNQDYELTEFSFVRFICSPLIIFGALALICWFWSPTWLRVLVYFVFGLTGVFITYIWIITLHPELTNNFNVLWCNPFYLFMIPIAIKKFNPKYLVYILWSCLGLTIVLWISGIQRFDYQIISVVTLMTIILLKDLKRYQSLN